MSDFEREILSGFVDEANGYLPELRAGLVAFRAEPVGGEQLEVAHRGVHTIKGAAAMVGLPELSHIAYHLEEIVERLMHEPDTATPKILDGIELSIGHLEEYMSGVASGATEQPVLAERATRHLMELRGLDAGEPEVPVILGEVPSLGFPEFEAGGVEFGELPAFEFAAVPPKGATEVQPNRSAVADDFSTELLEVFRLEAEDHLRVLTTLLPEARTDPTDRERWQTIRRAAHTLKGTAGLVGFDEVTQLAHRMEDLLDRYYEGTRTATGEEIDALLAASDAIAHTIEERADPVAFAAAHSGLEVFLAESIRIPAELAQQEPNEVASPIRAARESTELTVRVPVQKLEDIAKLVGELVIARTALEQRIGEFGRLLSEARPTAARLARVSNKLEVGYEASALAGGSSSPGSPAYSGGGNGFDSLEFDRYTEFHILSRELAETTTDVQTVLGEFGDLVQEAEGQLTRQARLASEVEDKLMRLRMVPLSTLGEKLARTVRTAAASSSKQAEFEMVGERTGLDKTVLEAMADPLLHLLRNAVDHGLESPEVRLALGKPAHGTIRLSAAHEGSHVVLKLSEDGRGIDFDAVRATAIRRGLLDAEQAEALSVEELTEYLFHPGFSTRSEISELSGRGVGLDVVKSKVASVKGTVSVSSQFGSGTTFAIRLPMTLAVVRALLVKSAGQTFAIPLEAIEQILRPEKGEIDRIGRNLVLRFAGSVCPLVPLSRVLRLPQVEESGPGNRAVVVLNTAGRRVALQIDALLGGREVVIKSLGRQMRPMAAVSGATLLGDGSVVLILNPTELGRLAAKGDALPTRSKPVSSRGHAANSALIVDDSPSVRRVLTMLLRGAGWQVTSAKDGMEALELLQRGEHPDVVLTDVEMPRMDGYELLAAFRSQAALSHLRVGVLTSRAADKHRRKALELGASAYIVKPYQDENLLEILKHLVRPVPSNA